MRISTWVYSQSHLEAPVWFCKVTLKPKTTTFTETLDTLVSFWTLFICFELFLNDLLWGYFYFPAPGLLLNHRSWTWAPVCLYRPWPTICIYRPWPPINNYQPLPPICVYQRCAPIFIYQPQPIICVYRLWPQISIYRSWPSICTHKSRLRFCYYYHSHLYYY